MSGSRRGAQPDAPVIRATTVGDWRALRAIRLRAMARDPDAFGSTHAQALSLAKEEYRRRAASGASLLAWWGDEPVGIVAIVPDEDGDPAHGQLVSMWVDPAHRGSGLAARLVEVACAQGRSDGIDEVALWVTVDNHTARRLYERCGLTLTGRRRPVRADDPDRLEEEMRRDVAGTSTLRPMTFGYQGDAGLGDLLLAAVLRGEKTATSSLAVEYLGGDQLPRVGERLALTDHGGTVHGVVETTRVTIAPLDEVGDDVARDEGEGFEGAAQWRTAHEAFWGDITHLVREDAGDPSWELREHEPVVVEWFRLVDGEEAVGP